MADPPTLADVAALAGVSRATASRALLESGRAIVTPGTLRKVHAAAKHLGYRRLRAPRSNEPVVVLPAPPVAYVALRRNRISATFRTATLYRERQPARMVADNANQRAANNGDVPDWDVYAIVPAPLGGHRPDGTQPPKQDVASA